MEITDEQLEQLVTELQELNNELENNVVTYEDLMLNARRFYSKIDVLLGLLAGIAKQAESKKGD